MVAYHKYQLDNGLKVILHKDESSPLVAVNLLYKVGSRDEDPNQTGFTHLFEHLMFGGTPNVRDFDTPIQKGGGENNAFTTSDFTNFYELMPLANLEVALWLESDRMKQITFSPKSLNTQKKVVIEEFKETCLNEPYGDMWHYISDMLYPAHPYNWPTIGKTIAHIETAKLGHVKAFYEKHYRPDQAILSICGDIDYANTEALVAQYFGSIQKEPQVPQGQFDYSKVGNPTRTLTIEAEVPSKAIVIAFKMSDRLSDDYYVADLISDILSSGRSSRLYQVLIKEKELFSSIDAYISSTFDDGAFVVDGKLNEGISVEQAREAIWEQLDRMKDNLVDEVELQKIKNKAESSIIFSETSILSKAMSLGYYEYLGNIDLINDEYQMYLNVTDDDIKRVSNVMFNADKAVELIYLPKTVITA